jgi:hypothetical protein
MNTRARRPLVAFAALASALALPLFAAPSRSFADAAPAAAASSSTATAASAARASGKLGYVDVERCFGETEEGLRAKAMLR